MVRRGVVLRCECRLMKALRNVNAVAWISALLLLPCCRAAYAAIWAKGATSLDFLCHGSLDERRRITSPDGSIVIEQRCRKRTTLEDVERLVLQITYDDGRIQDVVPEIPGTIWRPQELLWSPDSREFIINGSENAYAGFEFVAYRISNRQVISTQLTKAAQSDMVRRFPPCQARYLDANACKRLEESPEFNMSVIGWANNSASLIVFAEVACSSTYGGIMCEVLGYELEARTGRILRRMEARELKRHYQACMAWR